MLHYPWRTDEFVRVYVPASQTELPSHFRDRQGRILPEGEGRSQHVFRGGEGSLHNSLLNFAIDVSEDLPLCGFNVTGPLHGEEDGCELCLC